MKIPGKIKDKLGKGNTEPARRAASGQGAGAAAQAEDMSEAEYKRFEELFKTRLGDHVLAMSGLEWHEFDVKVFLEFLDACNLNNVCKKFDPNAVVREQESGKAPNAWEKQAAASAAKKRQREAYKRVKNEMTISEIVLNMLGTTADNVSISGFSNALRAALDDKELMFADKAVIRKTSVEKDRGRHQDCPRVFIAARDIIMSGERRGPEARMKDQSAGGRENRRNQVSAYVAASASAAVVEGASAAAKEPADAVDMPAEVVDLPVHDTAAAFHVEQLAFMFGQDPESDSDFEANAEDGGVSTPHNEFGQTANDVWFDEDVIEMEIYVNPETVEDDEDDEDDDAVSGSGSEEGEREERALVPDGEAKRVDDVSADKADDMAADGSVREKETGASDGGVQEEVGDTLVPDEDEAAENEFYDDLDAQDQEPRRMIEMFGF